METYLPREAPQSRPPAPATQPGTAERGGAARAGGGGGLAGRPSWSCPSARPSGHGSLPHP